MTQRDHICTFIGAVALVFVMLLPTSVQFSHLFEHHEHEGCVEQSTHIHQDEPDCHVCDFNAQSFQYTIPTEVEFSVAIIPGVLDLFLSKTSVTSQKLTSKQLRAPPAILS